MAICLSCSKSSPKPGILCPSCGGAYTVHDSPGIDPLNILGRLLAGKIVPTLVIQQSAATVYYEAIQPSIGRTILLTVLKPEIAADPAAMQSIQNFIDKSSRIKQQNTPNLLEVVDLPELKTSAITFEAVKGDPLIALLKSHPIDPVSTLHIIHQVLQALAAHHAKQIPFPRLSLNNIRIMKSGTDAYFIKLCGLIDQFALCVREQKSLSDDVYYMGQLALILLTGKPAPFNAAELPQERAFLLPIIQLFLRAVAPPPQRFETALPLLQSFELAFDMPHDNAMVSQQNSKPVVAKRVTPKRAPIPIEQIIWMHRPPKE